MLSNPRPHVTSDENVNHFLDSAHRTNDIRLLPLRLLSNKKDLGTSQNQETISDNNAQRDISKYENMSKIENSKTRALLDSAPKELNTEEKSSSANSVGNLGDKVELLKDRLSNTKENLNNLDKTSLKELRKMLEFSTQELPGQKVTSKYKLRRIDSESIDQNKDFKTGNDEVMSNTKDSGTSMTGNLDHNLKNFDILKDKNDDIDKKEGSNHKDSGLLIDKSSKYFTDNQLAANSQDWPQPNKNDDLKQQQKAATNTIVKSANEDIKAPVEDDHHKPRTPSDQSINNDLKEENTLKLIDKQESKSSAPAPKPKPIDAGKPSQSNPSKRPADMVEVNEDEKLTSTSNVDNKPNADDERKPNNKPKTSNKNRPNGVDVENKTPESPLPTSTGEHSTTTVEVEEAKEITSTSYMSNKPVASFSYNPQSPFGKLFSLYQIKLNC